MNIQLDKIFGSLADSTRRDILKRLTKRELSVSEIAEPYSISMAAVSKHLKVLERADLLGRRREGKYHLIQANLEPLKEAYDWISFYKKFWDEAFVKMDNYLTELQKGDKQNESKSARAK